MKYRPEFPSLGALGRAAGLGADDRVDLRHLRLAFEKEGDDDLADKARRSGDEQSFVGEGGEKLRSSRAGGMKSILPFLALS